jgi:hypothetical protein
MATDNDGSSIESSGRKLQVNGSDMFKDGGNDKAN